MNAITAYLNFNGNCDQAMTFYAKCLGGELFVSRFGDGGAPCAPGTPPEHVMHARLTKGSCAIMASDVPPGMPFHPGTNFSIALACESKQETEELFNALKEGGTVTLPLQDTFWNAYFGMITDRFGVNWMFNHEYPKAE